ncbi:MAG: DUF368 domain-containing protein [Acidimicrobiia bacterium]|nr:DUF368 domain-containing protein [Acidimicrobiia bacterium]
MAISVVLQVVRGFLMGCADLVPGVSGGTVALVLGIYQRLVTNIRDGAGALGTLLRADVRGFLRRLGEIEWSFLVPLLGGIGLAIVTLASALRHLLEEEPVAMAGLFFGLVVGSVVVAARMVERWDLSLVAITLVTGAALFAVLGLGGGTVADPPLWLYFAAGAVAICAMILPGVSGSFLLLMLGMYTNVLDAVSDRDLAVLAVLALGCVVGLALFSHALHWALATYERTVMAVLVGLLLGSLRILWPWPTGVGSKEGTDGTLLGWPTAGEVAAPVLLAVVGFVGVLVVTAVAQRIEGRTDEDLIEELENS